MSQFNFQLNLVKFLVCTLYFSVNKAVYNIRTYVVV